MARGAGGVWAETESEKGRAWNINPHETGMDGGAYAERCWDLIQAPLSLGPRGGRCLQPEMDVLKFM